MYMIPLTIIALFAVFPCTARSQVLNVSPGDSLIFLTKLESEAVMVSGQYESKYSSKDSGIAQYVVTGISDSTISWITNSQYVSKSERFSERVPTYRSVRMEMGDDEWSAFQTNRAGRPFDSVGRAHIEGVRRSSATGYSAYVPSAWLLRDDLALLEVGKSLEEDYTDTLIRTVNKEWRSDTASLEPRILSYRLSFTNEGVVDTLGHMCKRFSWKIDDLFTTFAANGLRTPARNFAIADTGRSSGQIYYSLADGVMISMSGAGASTTFATGLDRHGEFEKRIQETLTFTYTRRQQ